MKFKYLQGDEALAVALKINHVVPKETSNLTTLGALGSIAASLLSELVAEAGEEALIEVLEDWTAEIAVKAMMIASLQKSGFDFDAWAAEHLPTAWEA